MAIAFVALFAVWIGLTRQFDPWLLTLGAAAAVGVAYVQRRLFPVINLSLDALIRRPGAAFQLLAVEVEVLYHGKRYLLRTPLKGVCGKVLQRAGVAIPPPVREMKEEDPAAKTLSSAL